MVKTTMQWDKPRDWEWLVEPDIIPPTTETPKQPISAVKQGYQWDNPTDESWLFIQLIYKLLFKKDNQYGYYTDGIFTGLGISYPTKEQFKKYGMDDLSMLEAGDVPVEYNMELISSAEEEKYFSYSFDLNGDHKNLVSIDGVTFE